MNKSFWLALFFGVFTMVIALHFQKTLGFSNGVLMGIIFGIPVICLIVFLLFLALKSKKQK